MSPMSAETEALFRRRCARYEQHMAENVPPEYWPEGFDPPAVELPDTTIRAVIEVWERAGCMTEQDGTISPYVCDRVRSQIKSVGS